MEFSAQKFFSIMRATVRQPNQPVSMPMPAPEVERKQPNSLWASNRKNFFKDQRASQVGDIVTVLISIKDEAQISIRRVADKPGVAAAIFGPLADAHINVDMIVQNTSADGRTDITFTVPVSEYERAQQVLAAA